MPKNKMQSHIKLVVLLYLVVHNAYAQFPFEKFPPAKLQKVGPWEVYSRVAKEGKVHWTKKLPDFYPDSSSMTIQLTSFVTYGKDDKFIFLPRILRLFGSIRTRSRFSR